MITSVIIVTSLGIFGFKPVTTASIDYEPIKITVNKNYYAQPEFEGQAESIYSKPHINIPPGYIPSYIKSLISSIKQKTKLCSKETSEFVDKEVSEILKPLANPLPDFTKGTLPGIVSRKESITEIIKLLEDLLAELVAMPEEDKNIEIVKPTIKIEEINNETLFMENSLEISSEIHKISTGQVSDPGIVLEEQPISPPFLPMSIIFNDEPIDAFTEQVATIPEIPVLSSISLEKKVNIEEALLSKESMKKDVSLNDENYPITSKVDIIPEAPTLAPLSLEMIPSFAKKVKIEKQVPLEPAEVSPQIELYSTVVWPNTYLESEKLPPLPPPLPIKFNNKPNVETSEVVIIPEAPVLPPLSLDFITPIADEVRSDESRAIQEFSPILLPDTSLELEEIPPPQPPLPISIKINDEPNPITSEIITIPEVPMLPALSLNVIPYAAEEKKIKEPLLLEDSEVSRTDQEVSIISLPDTNIELEEIMPPQPPLPISIKINDEPNPVTSEFVNIPEAPVLPPLSLDIIPPISEKVKIKEPLLLEDSEVSHTDQEVSIISLPDTNIELEEMMPPQPPLPISIKINDEPNPVTSEIITIPEAPVLPPLSLDIIPPIPKEVNIKERLLLEDSEVSRAIQEISPILLPDTSLELEEIPPPQPPLPISIKINDEPNPVTSEIITIPEAPVLPPLSLNVIPYTAEERKIKEPLLLEDSEVSRTDQEVSIISLPDTNIELEEMMPPQPPLPISIKINDEPNPVTSEVVTIPEAPVLPPLSLDIIPPIPEKVKIKEPLLPEDLNLSRPIQEMSPILLEGSLEREEMTPSQRPLPISIKMYDNTNLETSEPVIISQAPVVSPHSSIVEEVKNEDLIFGDPMEISPPMEESNLLKGSIELGNTPIVEISSRPIFEPIPKITNSEVLKQVLQVKPCRKCITSPKKRLIPSIFSDPRKRLRIFTDAPFLSHLSTGLPKRKALENITPTLTSQEPYLIQQIKTNPRYRLSQTFNPHTIMMNRFHRNSKFRSCTSCALNINRNSIKKSTKSIKKYVSNKRI